MRNNNNNNPPAPIVVSQVRVRKHGLASAGDTAGDPLHPSPGSSVYTHHEPAPMADPMVDTLEASEQTTPAMYAMTGTTRLEQQQGHHQRLQFHEHPKQEDVQQHSSEDEDKKKVTDAGCNYNMWIAIAIATIVVVAIVIGLAVGLSDSSDDPSVGGPSDKTEQNKTLPENSADVSPSPDEDATDPPTLPSSTPPPTPESTTLFPTTISPTTIPSSTPAPTSVKCKEERDDYATCLQMELDSFQRSSCDTCAVNVFNTASRASCMAFTKDFCDGMPDCNCGPCRSHFRSYTECFLGAGPDCLGVCSTDPNATPAPTTPEPTTPAPDSNDKPSVPPTVPCEEHTKDYQRCLGTLTQAQVQECIDCANQVIRTVPRTNCEVWANGMCRGIHSCNCGWCADELLEWADCAIDGPQCNIDCTTVPDETNPPIPPTDPPTESCSAETQAYETCAAGLEASQEARCVGCVNLALQKASRDNCFVFNQEFCPVFANCDCGQCAQAFEDWVDCSVGTGCTVECPELIISSDPPTKPPMTIPPTPLTDPPTKPPIPIPPTPPETDPPTKPDPPTDPPIDCRFEESSYVACLNNRLPYADAQACVACTNAALNTTERLCSLFNREFCEDFRTCWKCGVCADLIVDWVDCRIGGPQCKVDCETIFTSPPTPEPTTPPPATDPPERCITTRDAYRSCLVDNLASNTDSSACITCINGAIEGARTDFCSNFEDDFCADMESCSICGPCLEEITEHVDCLVSNGNCGLDCEATDPPPLDCSTEKAIYQACFPSLGSNFRIQQCVDCYNAILPSLGTATTCSEFNTLFCTPFAKCDCGSCGDELTDFLDCNVPSCNVFCSP